MVNQDYMFAGGKPDAPPPADATRSPKLTDAQRSVAGRGRVATYPVSFAMQTGGLPKKVEHTIAMDDPHHENTESCPTEVFLG